MYKNWSVKKSVLNPGNDLMPEAEARRQEMIQAAAEIADAGERNNKYDEIRHWAEAEIDAQNQRAGAASDEYAAVAQWCNESGQYTIVEGDDDYHVEPIPEPTIEEKQAAVRAVRDSYLVSYVDPVVSNPLRWGDLSADEQDQYANYRRYLLDYTDGDNWWESNPMTFDEWKNKE